MKSLLFSIIILATILGSKLEAKCQVTDNIIVKSLLDKNVYDANRVLDSLSVWYHQHVLDNPNPQKHLDIRSKVYSISDSKGSVKVYFLKWNENKIIDEVVINFRHDSKEQVEDAGNMIGSSDYHVGYYSTDIVYKSKLK